MAGDRVDFFVSHAGADRAWAEWVAWQLLDAGYAVELDVWDWTVGQNFVTAMNDALARADRVVALLSGAYFQRERYTTEEWSAALAHVPGAEAQRLVPLRVEDVPTTEVPALLRGLVYSDLFGLSEDTASRVLLEAVAGPRSSRVKPRFPGAHRAIAREHGLSNFFREARFPTELSLAADVPRSRKVFVVYGRNKAARFALFAFLRSIGLSPIEWSQALAMTGQASPYIGDVLDVSLRAAQAVIVLLTPDEIASLREAYADGDGDPEVQPAGQARPNVIFEAGLSLALAPERTVLVELGQVRPFSDIGGRHMVRINNSIARRQELASRLQTAGCTVDLSGTDWHTTGDFTPPPP